MLWRPDISKAFQLHTDWSSLALGAVLTQKYNFGREFVVAYASQKNNTAEANYLSYEEETLAAVWVIAHFRPYLYDQRFTLVTNHQPLRWLMESDKLIGKFANWILLLQEYHFEVVHRVGITNLDVDELSRNPSPSVEDLTGLGGMEIVIEMRFQVGTRLLTSLCSLTLLMKLRYKAWMMRLIDLKLLWIYGWIFSYCISFSKGPFCRLPRYCKGIGLDIE